MKRKLIAIMLGTMLCATFLTACGSTESRPSPIIDEEISEETLEEKESETDVEESESTDEEKTDMKNDKESVSDNEVSTDPDTEDEDTVSENSNEDSDETESTDTSKEEKKDPYAGLAVAKCHSVTLPMGTSYNDAIAEVIKGTSAYPDTFPNISMANLDVPGVYSCYWEQKQADGSWLPLNYAVFTVTIYDPNPAPVEPTPAP